MIIRIRSERHSDYSSITLVHNMAFEQEAEGLLVKKLRKTKKFLSDLSLVACIGNEIIGHILFYPIQIENGANRYVSLLLAPLSVIPELQGVGIGGLLVMKGMDKARKLGFDSVIVFGHETYFSRFGFRPASQWNIKPPFKIRDKAFLIVELQPGALKQVQGKVSYPLAYMEV